MSEKILEQQNQLILILIQQQLKCKDASQPGDLSKQSIQFDSFNPIVEKFELYFKNREFLFH